MKRLMILPVLAACAAFAADPAAAPAADAKKPAGPRVPVHQSRNYMKRMGGDVIQPGTMRGNFAIVNGNPAADKAVDAVLRGIKAIYKIDTRAVKPSGVPTVATADKVLFESCANAAVIVIDDPNAPSLVAAPESKWSTVNLAKLTADKPDEQKLEWRLRKELWRAFAYTCGGGASDMSGCVMNPVFSLADLDALATEMISPDGGSGIPNCFKKLGINPFRRCTYRDACREGWAPAPTNEFQKAIWERIKAEQSKAPTKGLKIEYDPKKGK